MRGDSANQYSRIWYRLPPPLSNAAVCAAAPTPGAANGTPASLNAGGLIFEKSAAIQMKSQAMTISPSAAEVRHFHKKCAAATH
jgi:hypothetical protein